MYFVLGFGDFLSPNRIVWDTLRSRTSTVWVSQPARPPTAWLPSRKWQLQNCFSWRCWERNQSWLTLLPLKEIRVIKMNVSCGLIKITNITYLCWMCDFRPRRPWRLCQHRSQLWVYFGVQRENLFGGTTIWKFYKTSWQKLIWFFSPTLQHFLVTSTSSGIPWFRPSLLLKETTLSRDSLQLTQHQQLRQFHEATNQKA